MILHPTRARRDQNQFLQDRFEALNLCLDVGGADKLMYGSDFPHNIGDMKGCLARVDALPAAQVKAVRSANAERIFKL